MKIFIAEKPDIGKAIANYLWKNDYKKQHEGCDRCYKQ